MHEDDRASVVVMSRDRRDELLTSLPRHRAPVVLVDNGSVDGSASAVRSALPGVTVVRLPADVGTQTGAGLPGPRVLGFMACATMVRRETFLAVGGFDPLVRFPGEEERPRAGCGMPDAGARPRPRAGAGPVRVSLASSVAGVRVRSHASRRTRQVGRVRSGAARGWPAPR